MAKLALAIYTRLFNLHRIGAHVLLKDIIVDVYMDTVYLVYADAVDKDALFGCIFGLVGFCVVHIRSYAPIQLEMIRVLPMFPGPVLYCLNTLLSLQFGVVVLHMITCARTLTKAYRQSRLELEQGQERA